MPTVCPQCATDIPPADINVATDVAYCRACDQPFPLSAMVDPTAAATPADPHPDPGPEVPPPANLAQPPIGCWYTDDGRRAEVGASLRSDGSAGPLVGAACFWNGITWLFVIIMGSEMLTGNFDDWFLVLFLLPFVGIGLLLAWLAALSLAGTARVRVGLDEGEVFVGVRGFGWRRRFRPADAAGVTVTGSNTRVNGKQRRHIVLAFHGDSVTFGTMLNEDRLRFVAGALVDMLGLRSKT